MYNFDNQDTTCPQNPKILCFITVSAHKIGCMMSPKRLILTILKKMVVKAEEILDRKTLNLVEISLSSQITTQDGEHVVPEKSPILNIWSQSSDTFLGYMSQFRMLFNRDFDNIRMERGFKSESQKYKHKKSYGCWTLKFLIAVFKPFKSVKNRCFLDYRVKSGGLDNCRQTAV